MPTSFATFVELSRYATTMREANGLVDQGHERSAAAMALAFRYLQQAFADGSVWGPEFRTLAHLQDTSSESLGAVNAQDLAEIHLGKQESVSNSLGALSATPDSDVSGFQGLLALMDVFTGPAIGESHEPQRVLSDLLGGVANSAWMTDLSAMQAPDVLARDPIEGTVLADAGMEADDAMFMHLAFGASTEEAVEPSALTELSTPLFRQDLHDATPPGVAENLEKSEPADQRVGTTDLEVLPLDHSELHSLLGKDSDVLQAFLESGLPLEQIVQSTPSPHGDFLLTEPSVAQPLLDVGGSDVDVGGNVGVGEASLVAFLATLQDLLTQGLTAEEVTLRGHGDGVPTDAELSELETIGLVSLAAVRDSGPKPQGDPAPRPVQSAVAPARRRPRVARHARARVQKQARRSGA